MVEHNGDHEASADADLVLRARSGNADAFGELWRRHYASGMTVARSITSSIDPDDLVQEAYARIYQAILKGGGPNGSFRAYLFTSIRNTAAAWGRAKRETAIDELETIADPSTTDTAASEALDHGLTAQAFRALPSRWQEVLWYSEIEQMKPAAIGPLLGMTTGAVSQLMFRAREGLREAWIQAHLRSVGDGSECQWTIEQLGAHARGNLGARAQKRADEHLESCARCMIVAAEAKDVSSRLALVLLPLVLGVTGASGYLAAVQGGGAPIVALAAMPSTIIEGAVVVAPSAAAAGGAGAGAGASTASASSTSTGSGAAAGIGALVSVGSAALVVAGVVAAAAVVPGMLNGAPATSPPNASDSDGSSIASEVSPDASMAIDEPVVINVFDDQTVPAPVPEVEPPSDADAPPTIETSVPLAPVVPPASIPPEPDVTPELKPSPGEGGDTGVDPGPAPEPKPDPGTKPAPDPAPEPTPDPGTDPTPDPGTDPDTDAKPDPGTDPAPAPDEGTEPEAPAPAALNWGTATRQFEGLKVHYLVPVSGTPGATVQVWIDQKSDRSDQITLDEAGDGIADLRPNVRDLAVNSSVGFRYVVDGVPGEWALTDLRSLR